MGKTAAQVVIEKFLKDVDETGQMPWQRPYERYNAFNYFSLQPYRGINRLILPFGEYVTKNQMLKYNEEKGYVVRRGRSFDWSPDAYRMIKGIKWYSIVFFKQDIKQVTADEVKKLFTDYVRKTESEFIGKTDDGYVYYTCVGNYYKKKNISRYYDVADIKYFRNARGECLPSKIETGEVFITKSEPSKVFSNYILREGIRLKKDSADIPCYIPAFDAIELNPYHKNEDTYWSTAFHEAGHSTGAANRLNRDGIVKANSFDKDLSAKEECIAEICAGLCCAETGVDTFETSGTRVYDNAIAYTQHWKKCIKDWGVSFIYIVSEADKAFNYICNSPDSSIETEESEGEN